MRGFSSPLNDCSELPRPKSNLPEEQEYQRPKTDWNEKLGIQLSKRFSGRTKIHLQNFK